MTHADPKRRELRLWVIAVLLVLGTYATLGQVRILTEWLRERSLLVPTLALLFGTTLFFVVRYLWRHRPGRREVAVLAVVALVYASLFTLLQRAEEAMHFLQYGLLGFLLYRALRLRRERLGTGGFFRCYAEVTAAVLTALLGWGDEGIQHLLPNRYYDLRDVAFNALAGGLAILALTGRDWARRMDRPGAGS
jgi:VanZ family protein